MDSLGLIIGVAIVLLLILGVLAFVTTNWAMSRLTTARRPASATPDRDLTGAGGTTSHVTGPEHGEVVVHASGEHNGRPARTTGATVPVGTEVRVVGIDGSTLIVDPGPQDDPPQTGAHGPRRPQDP